MIHSLLQMEDQTGFNRVPARVLARFSYVSPFPSSIFFALIFPGRLKFTHLGDCTSFFTCY